MDQYLTIEQIALGMGMTVAAVQKAAERGGWQRRPEHTGRRGRPRFLYLLSDAMTGLGLVA